MSILLTSKLSTFKCKRHQFIMLVACAFYITTAFNSTGYFHWDEHYQIIEFANYKMGNSLTEDLAWEYNAAIRPSLQPGICYVIFVLLKQINVSNPFTLAFILRIITALTAIKIIEQFILSNKCRVKPELFSHFFFLSYFLWFLPLINVRFSAETLSGLTFLASSTLILRGYHKLGHTNLFILGVTAGLAILFKYQTAILVSSALVWLLIIDRVPIRNIISILFGIFSTLALGFLLDIWLYERPVFSIYNYFWVNIVEGTASNFGVSPWYEIILYILQKPGPVWGVIILVALFYFVSTRPRDLITWIIIPYIIIHSIIPHKEVRFLFPLINFLPFIIFTTYEDFFKSITNQKTWLTNTIFITLGTINLVGLIKISSEGAGRANISVASYLNQHYKDKPINLVFEKGTNPYQEWPKPKNTFYVHDKMKITQIESIERQDLFNKLEVGRVNFLLIHGGKVDEKLHKTLINMNFEPIFRNSSVDLMLDNSLFEKYHTQLPLILYKLKTD